MSISIPEAFLSRLVNAQRVVLLSGAGVAAESGIPSPSAARVGPWAGFDLMELSTPQAYARNPRLVWNWYAYRRRFAEAAAPSPSHYALVDIEQHIPDCVLITQSVDGLHWRAGSRDLVELYGSFCRVRCFDCGTPTEVWQEDELGPPLCSHCGGNLRPDVVMYGEGVPSGLLDRAYRATEQAEIFISVGAQANVQPAARLPLLARRSGAMLVEISPDESALSVMADLWLPYKPGEILPQLAEIVMGGKAREEGA